jgi:hypothetical protein
MDATTRATLPGLSLLARKRPTCGRVEGEGRGVALDHLDGQAIMT